MRKKTLLKPNILLLFLHFFCCGKIFPQLPLYQADLSVLKPSWQAVMGGETVAPPAETSYGFAAVTDGRMISACTQKGVILWQKSIKGKPEKFLSSWNDFLIVVTDKSILNLVNPSGSLLWSADCGFEVTQKPFSGWDGRIFVRGAKTLACFGIKGSLKWKIELEETANSQNLQNFQNLPTACLPDGSLLVVLSKNIEGKSCGLRISPFGKILEEITFSGKISCLDQCPEGVILGFSDGSTGLFSVQKENSFSSWVLKPEENNIPIKKIICRQDSSALLLNNGTDLKVRIVENKTGSIIQEFFCGKLNLNLTKYCRPTERGFFISDSFRAIEFDKNGSIFWEAKLPSEATWNFITFTDEGQILLCMKNWVLNAFLMSQSVGNKKRLQSQVKNYTTPSKNIQSYDGTVYSPVPFYRVEEIASAFCRADFSTEKEMTQELMELSQSFIEELFEKNRNPREQKDFYSANPLYVQKILQAMSSCETDIFASDFAKLLELEDDPLILEILIDTSGNFGYDEGGVILQAYEIVAEKKLQKKDVRLAKMLCDSTYKIVSFMGRPALYRQGKKILSNFMTDRFDRQVGSYAMETFTKILNLEL